MRIEHIESTAGEPRVAGGVGLGKVESGGTPARHTLSEHLGTSTSMRRGSKACSRQSDAEKHEQGCGGAGTHCHWHLSQVLGDAAMAGSVAGVSLVAMARIDV